MSDAYLYSAARFDSRPGVPPLTLWSLAASLMMPLLAYGQGVPVVDPSAGLTPSGDSGRDIQQLIEHSATGLALPNAVIGADLELEAGRTHAWRVNGQHRFLLDGNVRVALGSYRFRAERVVAIVTPQQREGQQVHELALYFDEMREIGGGAIRADAPRLLVTAVTRGTVRLETDAMVREPADANMFVQAALDRVQRHRQALAEQIVPVPAGPPIVDETTLAQREARRTAIRMDRPDLPAHLAQRLRARPLIPDPLAEVAEVPRLVPEPIAQSPSPATGQVSFTADRIIYQTEEQEGYVLLMGNIQVMYVDPESDQRLNLVADSAVIFTEPNALGEGARSSDAGAIRGVYLEDNVRLTDGDYTLRGPRVFYDFRTDQAVVLEAVLYTWDVERQIPLYVRADSLRQHARNQWSATNARLSTSEFAEPHFSIGVDRLTITADAQPEAPVRHTYEAEGLRFNVGDTSIFYWPEAAGAATDLPIQRASLGAGSRRGAFIETQWDLFALLDTQTPRGVNASLLIDGYTERGPGVGVSADYDVENAFGEFDTYYLYDDGEDKPGGRARVDPLTHHRNRTLWRHRHDLGDNWEATAELAWLSDPTFLEEFYQEDAYAAKNYESLFYLKHQEDEAAFTFLASYDLLDHVPQLDRLQTRGNMFEPGDASIGYGVHKYPEISYHRIATSLFEDRVTWYSENRASVMQLNLPEDRPEDRGFTDAEAVAFFGMANANQRFGDALLADGFDEERRLRGDTRQELQLPLNVGPVTLTPYVTGRLTAYDDDFADYRGEEDNLRLWAALGVKAHTSFSRTYGDVESSLLDMHRLRHIIEPSVNVFFADSSIQQRDLPVYDYDVESLADGTVFKLGVRNTLQTQRGGPGNWRSVDMLRVDTEFVFASNEVDRESPIGRFFDYRPENSMLGDYVWNEVAWQVTDTFSLLADVNYSFDSDEVERWNAGAMMDHTPRLSSFINYREIERLDSALVRYGFEYLMTSKYHVGFSQSYDVERNRLRNLTVTLTRRMPRWLLIVAFDHDSIGDVTSAGIALAPEGFGGPGRPERNPFLIGGLESQLTR
ncbi:MAG: LPS assembly protein LptD [Phycisphaeraceae bacterium]